MSHSRLAKFIGQVEKIFISGVSRAITRRATAAILAQLVFSASMSLSAQSIAPKTRQDWIDRLSHRPKPPFGVLPGLWDATAEYSNLSAAGATAINDWGNVVGNYCEATPACQAATNGSGPYLLSQGQYTSLPFPPAIFSAFPSGINLADQIVGPYFDANFGFHGFVLRDGRFTSIDAPEAGSGFFLGTVAAGINTQGEVVGQYFDASGYPHDFVWRDGKFLPFSLPIASSTDDAPTGINDRGDVVGYFYDKAGVSHGYLLRCGVATQIDFPGAASTEAFGINFDGDIVGYYSVPSTNPYASTYYYGFLLRKGKYTTINPPTGSSAFDGAATFAYGINDLGIIVGNYQTPTGPGSAQILGFIRRW